MKTLLMCASFLATTAGLASASPGGINLGWGDCGGLPATLTETFACNSNTGIPHILIGSFVARDSMTLVTGYAGVLDLQTSGATLSPWWEVQTGGCRGAAAIVHSADFTSGPFTCTDYWAGGATGGMSYSLTALNRARIKVAAALPAGDSRIGPITENTEVYCYRLTINNSKTVGTGACAGCLDEACIVFNSVQVTQVPGTPAGNFDITLPAQRAHVIWQAWTTPDPTQQCPAVTPVKNRTWGSIKAVYR